MQKKTRITLLFLIISLVPVIVACSGGGQTQKVQPERVTKPEPVTFTVGMGEYSYEPDTIQVKIGQDVTLKLVNNGVLAHELMIGKDVAMKDGRPNGYTVDLFESTNVEPMIMAGTMGMGDEQHKGAEAMDDHMGTGTMVTVENSGEEAFIKKMAGESVLFKDQVHWFSSLVSQKENLKNIGIVMKRAKYFIT